MLDVIKNEHFEELRTPNAFWCTFEEAKACQKLLDAKTKVQVGSHKISLKRARDPSDILWENRGMSDRQRACRGSCFLFFVLSVCIVYIIWLVGFVIGWKDITNFEGIGNVDCDSVKLRFPGDNLK